MNTDATSASSREVPGLPRAGRLRHFLAAAGWPLAVVAAVVVLNLPALVHFVDVNPLGPLGHTASHISGNLLPGLFARDPDVGYTAQALGHRAALDWLHGIVPWWNPYEGVGAPLAAEMQSAALYPPVLLFALADGSLYFHMTMEAAAGLGTYLLCRELGLSRPVATVGGILFAFSGTFAWLWHAPMNPVPLLPFSLLGVERTVRRPESHSGFVILALALALSVYGGFPEATYLDLLLVVAWATLRLVLAGAGRRLRIFGRYLLGAGTGLLLAMPLLLAFVEYLPHAGTGYHSGSSEGHAHLTAVALPILGLPYLYGPVDAFRILHSHTLAHFWGGVGGFVTAGSLVAGLIGVLAGGRDRALRYFLGATFVVVLLWAFGVFPFDEFSYLPYARHVSVRSYSAPIFELPAVVLACFGLERLGADRRARVAAAVAGAGLLIFAGVELGATPGRVVSEIRRWNTYGPRYADGTLIWFAVLVVLVAAMGMLRAGRFPRSVVGLLLVLDAGAMCLVPELSAPRVVTVDYGPATYLTAHAGLGRFYGFWYYHGDYGSYFGVSSIDTSDNPVPKPWIAEAARLAPNLEPYRFDGKLVTAPPPAQDQAISRLPAYEAIDVRYYLVAVGTAAYVKFERSPLLRRVYDDGFIAIFSLPHPLPFFRTAGASCRLHSDGFDHVTVDCTRATTLVRAELELPGWDATVNGRPTPVLDEGLFGAVRLPRGHDVVSFSYAPPHIDLALAAFVAGLAILIGVPGIAAARRRRGRRLR